MKRALHARSCVVLITAVLMLAGCATKPQINWESRIGNYTYDQAVLEIGPPDKMAELQDGTKVAEWLVSRDNSGSFGFYLAGPFLYSSDMSGPQRWMRLTFSPDGKLTSHRRVIK